MRKTDEQLKREFDAEVAVTQAIQSTAEEMRKVRGGTSKYRDALVSVGLCKGVRTPKTRCYLYGLERNRPEHYARFLEDEAAMVAYAEKLENGADDLKIEKTGNVIYGAFRPFSEKNERLAGISPLQRAMADIGITTPATRLRVVK